MESVGKAIGWISGVTTLVGSAIALVWFFFELNYRITTLENQVQALYQSNFSTPQQSKKNVDEIDNSQNTQTLEEACAQLALKTADAIERREIFTTASDLESMMRRLGCSNFSS